MSTASKVLISLAVLAALCYAAALDHYHRRAKLPSTKVALTTVDEYTHCSCLDEAGSKLCTKVIVRRYYVDGSLETMTGVRYER